VKHNLSGIFVVLLFVISCTTPPLSPMDAMRTVQLSDGRTVSVGEKLATIRDLCEEKGKRWYFKEGTYTNPESISVELDTEQRIASIYFDYGTEHIYDKRIDHYKELFAASPEQYTLQANGRDIENRVWNNANLTFELVKIKTPEREYAYSVIHDRKLCTKALDEKGISYEIPGMVALR